MLKIILAAALSLGFFALAHAETFEVRMLNRGAKGSMVFEPDFIELKPGDSIKFIAGSKSPESS
jgi:plastocyanin